MQNNMKKSTQKNKGISLLVVLLLGSIMMLIGIGAATLALRSLKTSDARTLASKTLYTAEDAFACVRHNVNIDPLRFSADSAGNPIECAGQSFDFSNGLASDGEYTVISGGDEAKMTFTLPAGEGEVFVEVVRNLTGAGGGLTVFKGTTTVYAVSEEDATQRQLERLQEYYYESFVGADIMFVIDRSGSIKTTLTSGGFPARDSYSTLDETTVQDPNEEWGKLLYSLADAVSLFKTKVPEPNIGIVSFGTSQKDIGREKNLGGGHYARIPDIPLFPKSIGGAPNPYLPDNGGTARDPSDDTFGMHPYQLITDIAETNMSIALAIAGAELMNKYYPSTNDAGTLNIASSGPPQAREAGYFERIVFDSSLTFANLQDKEIDEQNDRDDNTFADYIIIISDGEPNGFVRHTQGVVTCAGSGSVFELGPSSRPGHSIFFSTFDPIMNPGAQCLAPNSSYGVCYDGSVGGNISTSTPPSEKPSFVLAIAGLSSFSMTSTEPAWNAMCNTTLIAKALKDENITIAAIGVGVSPEAEEWMENALVSSIGGDKLYKSVENFEEITEALDFLIEKIGFIRSL
jgi:hypothetical protein